MQQQYLPNNLYFKFFISASPSLKKFESVAASHNLASVKLNKHNQAFTTIVIYTTSAHLPALLHSTRLIGIKYESVGRVTLLLIELNARLANVHEFCR